MCIIFLIEQFIENTYQRNLIFIYFIYSLSKEFLITFYIIEKYLSKNKINIAEKGIIFYPQLIISISLSIMCHLLYLYLNIHFLKDFEYSNIVVILFYFLFIIMFNNKNYYSHHCLAIFLMIILIVIYFIVNQTDYFFLRLYICILSGYSYSLHLFLTKYINEIYFYNIYILGTLHGLLKLFLK